VSVVASTPEALIGQTIAGRYEVLRLIGTGGMAAVFEVRNTRLGRSFAMKVLMRDASRDRRVFQRFRREADAIARLKHPGIVEIVDWEALPDGTPAIVMEYLRGENLAKRLAAGPLAWPELARIADELLAALAIAHAHGIVHRDLKPENVFLSVDDAGDERVKLLDFGVAKMPDLTGLITTDERLLGTPTYMSPEQADGRVADIGPHSDVWSVGAILHEMATGQVPFKGTSVPSTLYRICHGSPPSVVDGRPDAPPAFVEVVRAALTRDREQRIADAAELRARLRDALGTVPDVTFTGPLAPVTIVPSASLITELDDGPTPSMNQRRKLAPVALAIGGAAVVLVMIAIGTATRSRPVHAVSASPATTRDDHTADAGAPVPVEAVAPFDAAAPVAEVPAAPVAPVMKPRTPAVRVEPPAPTSTVVTPPPATPKKQCAKDDVECLYGDGT
jgi:serine/threonine protein kinase